MGRGEEGGLTELSCAVLGSPVPFGRPVPPTLFVRGRVWEAYATYVEGGLRRLDREARTTPVRCDSSDQLSPPTLFAGGRVREAYATYV